MMRWFREPTPLEKLERELVEAKAARITATAKAAAWKSDEKFRLAEISRIQAEIELIAEETSSADAAVVLEVGVAVEDSGRRPLPRIY